MYEGCSLTIGTRCRHCPFGVQPVFVWYLTSIVGYCTLLFSIYVLGSFMCLGMTLPIQGTNGFTWYPSHRRYTVFQCWEPGFYTLQILLQWSRFEPPTVAQPASVLPLSHTALFENSLMRYLYNVLLVLNDVGKNHSFGCWPDTDVHEDR